MQEFNYPTLVPYLIVRDTKKSIEFYEKAFGFTLTFFHSPYNKDEKACDSKADKSTDTPDKMEHIEMRYKESAIMFTSENSCCASTGIASKAPVTLGVSPSQTFYMKCDDVDALYAQATGAGAKSLLAPQDLFWGDRVFKVADPDGFEWMFAQPIKK